MHFTGEIIDLRFLGRAIVVGLHKGTLVWDTDTKKSLRKIMVKMYVHQHSIACKADGSIVVAYQMLDRLIIWHIKDLSHITTIPNNALLEKPTRVSDFKTTKYHNEHVYCLGITHQITKCALNPEGTKLAYFTQQPSLYVWDGTCTHTTKIHPMYAFDPICHMVYSPDGAYVVTTYNPGRICIWDMQKMRLNHTLVLTEACGIDNIIWSPDSTMILYSYSARLNDRESIYTVICIWDIVDKSEHWKSNKQGLTTALAWSPDSQKFVSSGIKLFLWDVASKRVTHSLTKPHGALVDKVTYSPDGESLAISQLDGTVHIYPVCLFSLL
jgi:WD40 repeat protein